MELVDPNVPPANPLSYFQVSHNFMVVTCSQTFRGADELISPIQDFFFCILSSFAVNLFGTSNQKLVYRIFIICLKIDRIVRDFRLSPRDE